MTQAANTVKMDSRKFLGALNDSAQARVAFFEERIQNMGKNAKKNWQLVALKASELYFEDTDTNEYFMAEHSKDGRKVLISNIRPIQIMEEEKGDIFVESCLKLVSAIEENDQKGMAAAFNRMKSQRFSGRVVPYSGYVRCRDNVLRKVNVSNGSSLTEETRARLISTIVEGLRDNVIVENGQVVSGTFNDGDEVKLPVTKWASRKLVARRMSEAAKDAYWSQGFQKRILHAANLVSEGKIEEAVKGLTPFLEEQEEFTLLTKSQTQTLIENALAANAIFNQDLCNDTATLFHRTNMRISRRKIIDEWRNIARKAEHPVLAENVQILSESSNFEAAYDKFLKLIFEAISNREVAAEALATTLEVLRNKTPKIKESHELASKLDGLIGRLKEPEFDDAAIYEAEDLIATIQEELAATETLGNFDQIPGGADDGLADLAADDGLGGGEGAPTININSPLIQIGGSSGGGGAAEDEAAADLGTELGGEELGMEEEPMPEEGGGEDELAALLGGGGGGQPSIPGLGEGKNKKGKRTVNESRPNHYEMKDDADDDSAHGTDDRMEKELEESNDPYAVTEGELNFNSPLIRDYGAPVITDAKQLRLVTNIMHRLAEEHNLSGKQLLENLESMAKAGIKAIGLRVPEGRLPKAIEEAIALFESDKPFPGAAPPFGSDDSDDSDDDDSDDSGKPWEDSDDDEGVAEDQLHGPRIPARGYGKSSYAPRTMKVEWREQQSDAILGEMANVPFIFDHGGQNEHLKPVILSEDGAVEIPIPEHLYNSAFAAADMVEDDDKPFLEWLSQHLEQLRPISEGEDRELQEAMAKITTTPEGQIEVEVSDDVGVGEVGDEMDDEFGGEGMEDDGMGMEPVDSLDVGEEEPGMEMGGEEDEMMPDYEGDEGMEMGDEPGMGGPDMGGPDMGGDPEMSMGDEEEEEDELAFEDDDITEPQSSKYTKHVKDNKRDMPAHKMPKNSDDKLDNMGPDLKKDDGSGTKPPTAKSMSNK